MTAPWHLRAGGTLFVLCLVLGGGTRPGFLGDVVLQLASVPLLVWSLWLAVDGNSPSVRQGLLLCGAFLLLPLVQIIPLPPDLWRHVPGRAHDLLTYDTLGAQVPWLPISVYKDGTILSALALLPPAAIFLSVLVLPPRDRRTLTVVFVGFGIISIFLGLTQLSQGPSSPLRFFEITNPTDAVGFFANRNHYAALLYSALVFTIAWTIDVAATHAHGGRYRAWRTVFLVAGLTTVIALVAGSAMARSRAGIALTMLALFGGVLLALRARSGASRATPARLLGAAIAIGAIMAGQVALYRVLERFAVDPLQDARGVFARQTLRAIEAYFPMGSGLGTFTRVYPIYETSQNALLDTYVNRAHNDVLEFALEGGVLGIVLMACFALKLATSTWRSWFRRSADAPDIDVTLERAATIVLLLLGLHALVDYPLRTNALGAVFALSAGLLFAPAAAHAAHRGREQETAPVESAPRPGDDAAQKAPRKPWGQEIAWPDAWTDERAHSDQKKPP